MSEQKDAIFSKTVKAGSRTYFVDVKESAKGDKYLTICESRKVNGSFKRERIMVFEDNIASFFQALREAGPALKG